MAVADRIAKLVERRNKKLAKEAWLDVAMGVFWLTVIYGMLLVLSYVWFMRARFASPGQWSLGFTIGTATCCALLAWRQVDPLRGIAPMTNTQKALTFISHASPHMLYFSPLHAAGGLVELLTSGFRPLFDGIGQFLNPYLPRRTCKVRPRTCWQKPNAVALPCSRSSRRNHCSYCASLSLFESN